MKHDLPIILGAGIYNSFDRHPKKTVTNKRIVKTYELEYFFESGGKSVINGKEYPIKRGNLLFARPGDVRYSHLPFTCKYIHFDVKDAQLCSLLETINSVRVSPDSSKTDKRISRIISDFYSANKFDNLSASAELISLLRDLSVGVEELSVLSVAQRFIESNFSEDISTEDIARESNISISYLHKIFKNGLDTSPGEYLTQIRISAAKEMLANSNLSLSEIAIRSGFNSQSYFSDSFKRQVGLSPSEFRKSSVYLP